MKVYLNWKLFAFDVKHQIDGQKMMKQEEDEGIGFDCERYKDDTRDEDKERKDESEILFPSHR